MPLSPNLELDAAEQAQMRLAWAASLHAAQPHLPAPRWIETHISWVLLDGEHAWKIKKPLRKDFIDQGTLAARERACREELRLNRRFAPSIYLRVQALTGERVAPQLDGLGPVLEWAVQMRAFDPATTWDALAGHVRLDAGMVEALLAQLLAFQREAARASADSPFGSATVLSQQIHACLDGLQDGLQGGPQARVQPAMPDAAASGLPAMLSRLRSRIDPALREHAPLLERRRLHGRVREGHGDLHLGNIAQVDGQATMFDGIDFSPALRWIDVANEVAFLAMDLHAHAQPSLAHRLVDGWLAGSDDYEAAVLFDLFMGYRALVRARVAWMRVLAQGGGKPAQSSDRDEGHRYLHLADTLMQPRRAALLVTHGLSGSGKSTLTQELVDVDGAVRIRADVQRKRLAGMAPLQSSGSTPDSGIYTPAMTEATYDALFERARPVIASGRPAILDATFLMRGQRDAARALATQLGVPFVLLHFDAEPDTLRERIRRRRAAGRDASEADESTLELQLARLEPLAVDEFQDRFDVVPLSQDEDMAPRADWRALRARLQRQR